MPDLQTRYDQGNLNDKSLKLLIHMIFEFVIYKVSLKKSISSAVGAKVFASKFGVDQPSAFAV